MSATFLRAAAVFVAVSVLPLATPASIASMADKADEPLEKWLKRILELKQAGKTRESDEELAKFRKRYPDYVLPEALRAQK